MSVILSLPPIKQVGPEEKSPNKRLYSLHKSKISFKLFAMIKDILQTGSLYLTESPCQMLDQNGSLQSVPSRQPLLYLGVTYRDYMAGPNNNKHVQVKEYSFLCDGNILSFGDDGEPTWWAAGPPISCAAIRLANPEGDNQ